MGSRRPASSVSVQSGTRFFFYGTLRDAAVRARVLGARTAAALRLAPAEAPGWRAVYARGRDFPILVPERGAAAPGMVAEGLGRGAVRRLIAYEGAGYRLALLAVKFSDRAGKECRAVAFLPRGMLQAGRRSFDLAGWQSTRRGRFLKRLARRRRRVRA